MSNNRILALMPHPDDIEILCAGTLIRLKALGFEIHTATMTPGDKGSAEHTQEEIAAIRREEGKKGSAIIGAASHHCLEFRDLEITFDNPARLKVAAQLRRVNPFMVFTTAPHDYMFDHEITSALVRDACFASSAPLYPAEGTPIDHVPYLYYADAIGGHDYLGHPSPVTCIIDISAQIEQKADALKAHDSQRAWLMKQHGMDNYIESMKTWSGKRGSEIGVDYAEAFHQHLGHPHPQDNWLGKNLGVRS